MLRSTPAAADRDDDAMSSGSDPRGSTSDATVAATAERDDDAMSTGSDPRGSTTASRPRHAMWLGERESITASGSSRALMRRQQASDVGAELALPTADNTRARHVPSARHQQWLGERAAIRASGSSRVLMRRTSGEEGAAVTPLTAALLGLQSGTSFTPRSKSQWLGRRSSITASGSSRALLRREPGLPSSSSQHIPSLRALDEESSAPEEAVDHGSQPPACIPPQPSSKSELAAPLQGRALSFPVGAAVQARALSFPATPSMPTRRPSRERGAALQARAMSFGRVNEAVADALLEVRSLPLLSPYISPTTIYLHRFPSISLGLPSSRWPRLCPRRHRAARRTRRSPMPCSPPSRSPDGLPTRSRARAPSHGRAQRSRARAPSHGQAWRRGS